jgi:CRISPR-associated protein Csb1
MTDFDALLEKNGPVAIVVKERLRPVGGADSPIFPPTYAGVDGYCIDPLPDGHNRCVLDSVQSQANRIEPHFMEKPYDALVPQVTVKAGDVAFNVLQMAHRLGDASARFSSLGDAIDIAFKALADTRNAIPVAKLSPLSLILGVWDSRGTGVKVQRALGSMVYADDVAPLTRSAQFVPSFSAENVEDLEKLKKEIEKKSSVIGLAHVPSSGHGGVLAHGHITRESILNLIVIRQLHGANDEETLRLRTYLLALSLVALSLPQDYNLRSGCQLVRDGADAIESKLVQRDGSETNFPIDHDRALVFAQDSAAAFGIDADLPVYDFEIEKAKQYLKKKD